MGGALALALAAAWMAAPAHGQVRLVLGDGCLSQNQRKAELPLVLTGTDYLPSALSTSIYFDPSLLEPVLGDPHDGAVPGADVRISGAYFSSISELAAGRLDLTIRMQSGFPLAELREGVLARLRFRLLPGATDRDSLRLDLDPGRTDGEDGDGNPFFTEVGGPAFIWIAPPPLPVHVEGESADFRIEPEGDGRRDAAWVVRAERRRDDSRRSLPGAGRWVPLDVVRPGQGVHDPSRPRQGHAFFYMAARPDSFGRPLLSYDSNCDNRSVTAEFAKREE